MVVDSTTTTNWHVVSLCAFPCLALVGVCLALALGGARAFGSSCTKQRGMMSSNALLGFSMQVMFVAGVLLAVALKPALGRASSAFDAMIVDLHYKQEYMMQPEHDGVGSDGGELMQPQHDGVGNNDSDGEIFQHDPQSNPHELDNDDKDQDPNDRWRRRRSLQEQDDVTAFDDTSHVFPWANAIAGITFLFFMCVEAHFERIIDNVLAEQQAKELEEEEENVGNVQKLGHHANKESTIIQQQQEEEEEPTTVLDEMAINGLPPPSTDTIMKPANHHNVRASLHAQSTAVHKNSLSKMPQSFLVTARHPTVVGLVQQQQPALRVVDEKQTVNPWVALLLLVTLSVHVLLDGLVWGSSSAKFNSFQLLCPRLIQDFLGPFRRYWVHYGWILRTTTRQAIQVVVHQCTRIQCHGGDWVCRRHGPGCTPRRLRPCHCALHGSRKPFVCRRGAMDSR